jgi:hypothetical protein
MKEVIRQVFQQMIGGLVLCVLLLTPALDARAQQKPQVPPNPLNLSMAVETATVNTFIPTTQRLILGTATPADYSAMYASLNAMFANWNESGYTVTFQNFLLANPGLILTPYTTAQLAQLQGTVAKTIPAATLAEFERAMLQYTAAQREEFMTQLKTIGLAALDQQMISGLEQYAKTKALHGNIELANFSPGTCLAMGFAALWFSVAALACIACAPAFGAIALGLGVAGLYECS